ncbi:MAG: hypothetical protein AAGA06_12590 [Pseudomonadota bacterium]
MDLLIDLLPFIALVAFTGWLVWRGLSTKPDASSNKSGEEEDFRYYGGGKSAKSSGDFGGGDGD